MNSLIHPRAIVSPETIIGSGVSIDADAVIDADVVIGDGCHISPRAHLYPGVRLGENVKVFDGAIVGSPPQDMKFEGQTAGLIIGSHTTLREYTTLNSSVDRYQPTKVGERCLVMAYAHVAHDCVLENDVVLANRVQLGGHVFIGQGAVLGGGVAVQQFTRIGEYSFMGGTLKVVRDVPPWSRALGEPLKWAGLNIVGLRKAGFDSIQIKTFRKILDVAFASGSIRVKLEDIVVDQTVDEYSRKTISKWIKNAKNGVVRP